MPSFDEMPKEVIQLTISLLFRAPALLLLSSCQLFGGWKTIRHAKRLGMQSPGRPPVFYISDLTLPMSARHHPNWSLEQREELDEKMFLDLSVSAYQSRAEVLILSGFECFVVNVFAAIKLMPRLQAVELNNFPVLRSINLIAPNIRELTIKGCEEFKSMDATSSSWGNVKSLKIEDCNKFEFVWEVDGLKKLETLEMVNCGKLSIPHLQLHTLPRLETLVLNQMHILFSWMHFPPIITELTIRKCAGLQFLDVNNGQFPPKKLKSLNIVGCASLQVIRGLESLKELETLVIHWCDQLSLALLPLKELFTECPLLKTVQIWYNGYVGDEFYLPDFKQLEKVAKDNNVLFSHFKFA